MPFRDVSTEFPSWVVDRLVGRYEELVSLLAPPSTHSSGHTHKLVVLAPVADAPDPAMQTLETVLAHVFRSDPHGNLHSMMDDALTMTLYDEEQRPAAVRIAFAGQPSAEFMELLAEPCSPPPAALAEEPGYIAQIHAINDDEQCPSSALLPPDPVTSTQPPSTAPTPEQLPCLPSSVRVLRVATEPQLVRKLLRSCLQRSSAKRRLTLPPLPGPLDGTATEQLSSSRLGFPAPRDSEASLHTAFDNIALGETRLPGDELDPFEGALHFRHALRRQSDSRAEATLVRLELEAAIMERTYECVRGLEGLTVSKVANLVSTLADQFLGGAADPASANGHEDFDIPSTSTPREGEDAGGEDPAPSCGRQSRQSSEDSVVSESDVDVVVTAFHTAVTARLSTILVPHWRRVHVQADATFWQQCCELGDNVSKALEQRDGRPVRRFGIDLRTVTGPEVLRAAALLEELDNDAGSVFRYMRVAERFLTIVSDSLAARLGVAVTADVSLPVVVYLLAIARPRHLKSVIAYVSSFSLTALSISVLGYSFTTLEAAAQQLAQEHTAVFQTPKKKRSVKGSRR